MKKNTLKKQAVKPRIKLGIKQVNTTPVIPPTKYQSFLQTLDIPAGSIIGLFTLSIICLCWYSVISNHPISMSISTMYIGVVTGYAGTKAINSFTGSKGVEGQDNEDR